MLVFMHGGLYPRHSRLLLASETSPVFLFQQQNFVVAKYSVFL